MQLLVIHAKVTLHVDFMLLIMLMSWSIKEKYESIEYNSTCHTMILQVRNTKSTANNTIP